MHKILKLQHHSHTGRVLAHHHTSYRALFLLICLMGVIMGITEYTAHADDIVLTAEIDATELTIPAVILSPTNGSTVDTSTIQVIGTCQFIAPATVVTIYNNGLLAGSTLCPYGKNFSVKITLNIGANELIAKTSNVTNDYAPDSAPVQVTYVPPPVVPTITKKTRIPLNGLGLLVGSTNAFIIFGPYKDAVWIGSITGGKAPYSLTIDWDDGSEPETLRNLGTEELRLRHKYTDMHAHFIKITIRDTRGASREYTFAAVTPFIAGRLGNTPVEPWFDLMLALKIYAMYIVTIGVWWLIWLDARHVRPQPVFIYKKRRKDKNQRDKS